MNDRTVAIIQARMGSSRLPGKVLRPINGRPALERICRRVQLAQAVDGVVIATTTSDQDRAIVELGEALGIPVYCGPEQDVLTRYVGAATVHGADVVVRITADCPMVFPELIDQVVRGLGDADLSSNAIVYDRGGHDVSARTYPRGCDVEAFPLDALLRMNRLGVSQPAREHVTWVAYRELPERFRLREILDREDHSWLSWTVDTEEDYRRICALAEKVGDDIDYRRALGVALGMERRAAGRGAEYR